jgi:hypothetical protein
MNLMVVSEKHKYLVIAVEHELWVFKFDFNLLKMASQNGPTCIRGEPHHVIDLNNDNQPINNLKLIRCDEREFVSTVDFGGNVRMLFLDNLIREQIKFENVYP